jgi:hypothetical protein
MVRFDYHTHSNYSDGHFIPGMVRAAEAAGLDGIGFADHCNVTAAGDARQRLDGLGFALDETYPRRRQGIEWARTEGEAYGADPERVVGVGHSAGANLVVLAAATADNPGFEPELYPGASSELSAVVGYSGVYDFRAFDTDDLDEGEPDVHAQYLGGKPDEIPEAYELASPVTHADVGMPPTLLLHGRDDETVRIVGHHPHHLERFSELTATKRRLAHSLQKFGKAMHPIGIEALQGIEAVLPAVVEFARHFHLLSVPAQVSCLVRHFTIAWRVPEPEHRVAVGHAASMPLPPMAVRST